MNLFKKLFPSSKKETNILDQFPNSRHVIKHAFTIGDVEYFQLDDIFNLPYERGLTAIIYYREIRMNCDREFLELHQTAINNILTATNKIDIYKLKVLNDQLGQRLQLPPDTELLYKLASVVFFDKNEKPENYEFAYGQKKIDFWKKSASVKDFFLQKPLQELIPFLAHAEENLEAYHGMMQEVNEEHTATISASLSEEQKTLLNIKKGSSPAPQQAGQSSQAQLSTNIFGN